MTMLTILPPTNLRHCPQCQNKDKWSVEDLTRQLQIEPEIRKLKKLKLKP